MVCTSEHCAKPVHSFFRDVALDVRNCHTNHIRIYHPQNITFGLDPLFLVLKICYGFANVTSSVEENIFIFAVLLIFSLFHCWVFAL